MSNTKPPDPHRGEVWDVNFDPTIGSEIQKTRPAIVISSDGMRHLSIKLVVPITSWKPRFGGKTWYVLIKSDDTNGFDMDSAADTMQIRGIDVRRLRRKRGILSEFSMEEIIVAIAAIIEHK